MDINEEQIGARLQALRGPVLSQAGVAQAMKDRGHDKWSQATVWSVEAGKRPLRLSEAVSLASILSADVGDLVQSTEAGVTIAQLREAVLDVDRIAEAVTSASVQFEDARTQLRGLVRDIEISRVMRWAEVEQQRLLDVVNEANKRMGWSLADIADIQSRGDLEGEWLHDLGDDDGVDPEAS